MQDAVIIDCLRTAVGKAGRGALRNTRPDDMAAAVIRALLESELRARVEDEPANPGLLYCVFDP